MRALVGVCALAAPRYVRTSLIAHAGIGPRRRHCAPLASLERSAPAGDGTVAYVTDVEGDLAFWNRYCAISSVLTTADDGALSLVPGTQLVFGGDAVDKGGNDLAFLRSILGLKARGTVMARLSGSPHGPPA